MADPFLQDQAELMKTELIYDGRLSADTELLWSGLPGSNTEYIKTIEATLGLIPTGTLSGLARNFKERYYTVDCLATGHTENFCFVPAVLHGDVNTVSTIIE